MTNISEEACNAYALATGANNIGVHVFKGEGEFRVRELSCACAGLCEVIAHSRQLWTMGSQMERETHKTYFCSCRVRPFGEECELFEVNSNMGGRLHQTVSSVSST
eukprot:15961-Heterococcus_DN1.PRE.2